MLAIKKKNAPILVPEPGCSWADTMVLNPAVIPDPENPDCYHMLFRATGPCPEKQTPGKPLPYPISLGYAVSRDRGETWEADFESPALAPAVNMEKDAICRINRAGESVVDHANGCIEDPRLFPFEGGLYLTTACRMFPPGPYWENDEPMQCAPAWAVSGEHGLGKAASENYTVNVLWEVNLDALKARDYKQAFVYVEAVTNADFGENRDVFPFPERFEIDGEEQVVLIHRPVTPAALPGGVEPNLPCIYFSHAADLKTFARPDCNQQFVTAPLFDWEDERVGGSTAPLRISDSEWLLPVHGKKDKVMGYSQSFMILEDVPGAMPRLKHRCPERLFVADRDWEQPKKFTIPCVFTTGAFVEGDDLVMSYGAADEVCGLCRTNLNELLDVVRKYDECGELI